MQADSKMPNRERHPCPLQFFEKLVREQVSWDLTTYSYSCGAPGGITMGMSYFSSCRAFLDKFSARLDEREVVEVLYLDFCMAFESINHRLLMQKIHYFVIEGLVLN